MNKNGNEISWTVNKSQTGIWYKILRVFTDVYPGETLTVLLLTLNGFLLFLAYYIIKPLRDALMLDSWPAEVKSYLSAAIALFVLLMNFVNTNGVYMLDTVAQTAAANAVEKGRAGGLDQGQYLTAFFASFYNIQNLFAMFVQLFLVSRIFKWFGVRTAIFILPVFALGGYFFISFGAVLLLVKWVKALENGMDYSLMNTVRGSLFLITTR
jgi:ATP/ADP translocase